MKTLLNSLFYSLLILAPTTLLAQPVNDQPCNAIPLYLDGSIRTGFTNVGATNDPGEADLEPDIFDSDDLPHTVWFTFTAPALGAVNISLCEGSNFDTEIAVFSVSDCADFNTYTEIAANDDGCGINVHSSLSLTSLIPGTTYYLVVDGYLFETGNFSIRMENPNPANAPFLFNYQAVIRDATGAILTDQMVDLEFSIASGTANGPEVYAETHTAMTNTFGLVNLQIGNGMPTVGNMAAVNWGSDKHFLEVIVDGTSLGSQELLSVPYSAFATEAGSAANDFDRSPTNEMQMLSLSGNELSLSDGGTVTLSNFWAGNGENISNTNSGNVGIGTINPDSKLQVISQEAVGDLTVTENTFPSTGNVFDGNAWQSITASIGGYMVALDANYGGNPGGALTVGTLLIYEGEGTSGPVIHRQEINRVLSENSSTQNFQLSAPVFMTTGNQYTIHFTHFNWGFGQNTYSGGRSSWHPTSDFAFRVYMVDQIADHKTLSVGNGRVGIGTNTPREKLEVVGNICYTGTIGACSDERYKTDFAAIESPLDKIMQLSGYYYNWRQEEFAERQFTDERQIGVIAQEVQALFPEIVLTDEEGFLSVDYGKLTPILIEALKEQQDIINALQAESNQLRTDVMARLEALEESATDQEAISTTVNR